MGRLKVLRDLLESARCEEVCRSRDPKSFALPKRRSSVQCHRLDRDRDRDRDLLESCCWRCLFLQLQSQWQRRRQWRWQRDYSWR
jgi:hypothetical protein